MLVEIPFIKPSPKQMSTAHAMHDSSILRLVQIALSEDIGTGDVTSEALVQSGDTIHAIMKAKTRGVIAGTIVGGLVFGEVDRGIVCEWAAKEGEIVEPGTIIGHIHGEARSVLTAERTALNFMQRMSGVATATRRMVEAVAGTAATILDTRKTIPGWRVLDKYAVTVGGGENHRKGLYDMVMIKDNHIAAHGSIAKAVAAVRKYIADSSISSIPIEVETANLRDVSEALSCTGITRIMFDNFSLEMLGEGVTLVDGRCETEASGNVTRENVRSIAETGVQYISTGSITHSAIAMDISLDFHQA